MLRKLLDNDTSESFGRSLVKCASSSLEQSLELDELLEYSPTPGNTATIGLTTVCIGVTSSILFFSQVSLLELLLEYALNV